MNYKTVIEFLNNNAKKIGNYDVYISSNKILVIDKDTNSIHAEHLDSNKSFGSIKYTNYDNYYNFKIAFNSFLNSL